MEQLDRLRESSRKLMGDYEAAVLDRDAAAQAQQELYQRSEALAGEMQQREREVERIRGELAQLDEAAGELESALAVLKTEVRNNLQTADRLNREMDQQGDRAQSVAAQIADRERRLAEITGRRRELAQLHALVGDEQFYEWYPRQRRRDERRRARMKRALEKHDRKVRRKEPKR